MRLRTEVACIVVAVVVLVGLWGTFSAQGRQVKPAGPPVTQPPDVPLSDQSGTARPMRVVVAGLVHGHAEGFLSQAVKRKDIEIVGVEEPDRELFDQYAKKYGLDAKLYHADLEEMLKATRPQAVLVYTNTFDHRRVVEICANNRINAGGMGARIPAAVMMEKPLAVSAEDARAIAKASRDAEMPVLVNYFTTWEPSRHGAYEEVKRGAIGEVRKMVAHDGHGGPKEIGVGPEFLGWLTDPKLNGGGALYDFGCYGVDFMTWLMGAERPLTVTAVTLQIKPDVYPKVDDDATIILTYPKAVGIVQGSWNWPFGRSDVEIYGKTGEVKTVGRDALLLRKAGDPAGKTVQAPPLMAPEDDELKYLRAVVMEGLKPSGQSSLEINVVVAEVMDAARESSKTGRTVKMAAK
jgi:glucose-fructose oxidoreductase